MLGPDDLDARSFEQLRPPRHDALRQGDHLGASTRIEEALAIWRGPALLEVADEQFAQAEISRLEALHLQAWRTSSTWSWRWAGMPKSSSQLYRAWSPSTLARTVLVPADARPVPSGRQADALQSYQGRAIGWFEELGVDPGPELQRCSPRFSVKTPNSSSCALTPARRCRTISPTAHFLRGA